MPKIKDEFTEEEITDLDRLMGPLALATEKNDVLEGGDWTTLAEDSEG